MTDTIDATSAALDQPAPLDLASAPPLPPPPSGQPMPAQLPPPTAAVVPAAPAVAVPSAPPAAPTAAPPAAPTAAPPAPPPAAPPAPRPAPMTTGPSAIFSSDAAVIPVDHAAPMLPQNTPAVPSVPTTSHPAPASVFNVEEFLETQSTANKTPAKPKSRWLSRLVLVGLLGAGGWVGTQHGPALYDEYVRGNEDIATTEVAAPLAFPNVTTTAAPIRTAEFVLAGLPETPGSTYRVTTDFETNVSQVDIVRDNGPSLQILTYGDDAMIRRADGAQWYLLDRGQFPLDGRLERSDWVRRIDELIPSDVRNRAAIDASTESMVSGVPTRHLTLTVAPGLLGTVSADEVATADQPIEPGTTIADPSAPTPAPVATPGPTIEIEVWIDGEGLVRQVSGAPQLGAETITVVRTSADAWIPDYPTASAIAPLTASALVDLGL